MRNRSGENRRQEDDLQNKRIKNGQQTERQGGKDWREQAARKRVKDITKGRTEKRLQGEQHAEQDNRV